MWFLPLLLLILVAIGLAVYVAITEHISQSMYRTPAERERTARMQRIGCGCTGIGVVICLSIGFCLYRIAKMGEALGGPMEPPVSQILDHFLDHRADFERLRGMFEADATQGRYVRIGFEDSVEPDYQKVIDRTKPSLPVERLNAYVALFKALDLKHGEMSEHHKLRLTYHFNGGLLDAGPFCTGYAYPAPPQDVYIAPDLPDNWEIDRSCDGLSVGIDSDKNRVWSDSESDGPSESKMPTQKKGKKPASE